MNNVNMAGILSKEKRAKKRVKNLKTWYWSIPIYFVGTAMMVFLSFFIDPLTWMKFVLLAGLVLWWVFFIVQGVNLFMPKTVLMKIWEKRQIERFVEKQRLSDSVND